VSTTTEIIPSTDLPGLERVLGDVDHLTDQLIPLHENAKTIEVKFPDKTGYMAISNILSQERSLRKMGEAQFAPFNLIVDRVRTFLKTKLQKHTNACEEIDAICRGKMKPWEQAETAAAEAEEKAMNKKSENPVTVKPDIPTTEGYRRSTTYPVEVLNADAILKKWTTAKGKHKEYLRKFITIDVVELRRQARDLKDPERLMKLVPGIRAWKD